MGELGSYVHLLHIEVPRLLQFLNDLCQAITVGTQTQILILVDYLHEDRLVEVFLGEYIDNFLDFSLVNAFPSDFGYGLVFHPD